MRLRLTLLLSLLTFAAIAPVASAGEVDGALCAGAVGVPGVSITSEQAESAALCLINQFRRAQNLPELVDNAQLHQAAVGKSQDMISRGYFEHTGPDGKEFTGWVKPYTDACDQWVAGENLAWGTGSLGSPLGTVNAWLTSPDHRKNLLNPDFRESGLAAVAGTPKGLLGGATWTNHFGACRSNSPTDGPSGTNGSGSTEGEADPTTDEGAPTTSTTGAPRRSALGLVKAPNGRKAGTVRMGSQTTKGKTTVTVKVSLNVRASKVRLCLTAGSTRRCTTKKSLTVTAPEGRTWKATMTAKRGTKTVARVAGLTLRA